MSEIHDLRSALAVLSDDPEELLCTDHPVDPHAELAGVYKQIGAGGTVARPTQTGPAMLFNQVKGYPHSRVLVGLMASRQRVSKLIGCSPTEVHRRVAEAFDDLRDPVLTTAKSAPVQERVYRASDPDFDIRKLLPAPTNTEEDAGPYFCLGLLLGSDPDTGHSDVTIHRICVQGKDELSVFFAPGRHIDAFRQKANSRSLPLPITINMGLDPAIYLGACFEPPTTPLGFDELRLAGALRGQAVELVNAVTVQERAIARAEVVIEGLLLPDRTIREDINTNTGHAMPEFPGYNGPAHPALPVVKVTAVTTRHNPILQTLVGPGEEHTSLAGIPTEASILRALESALPGLVRQVHAHTCGGGKFVAIIQVAKRSDIDDGKARQAAIVALATYSELKNVILIDEDVDIWDTDDVAWAMTTRMVADTDIITIPGVLGHVLDPTQQPAYDPRVSTKGITSKAIFDATYPWRLRDRFTRARFRDVNPQPWLDQSRPVNSTDL